MYLAPVCCFTREGSGNREKRERGSYEIYFRIEPPPKGEEKRGKEKGDWRRDLVREREGFVLKFVKV
jgi:hypothetical protein